jgi:cytosine/adenosine deaminase-related metal-dependent hydrolase
VSGVEPRDGSEATARIDAATVVVHRAPAVVPIVGPPIPDGALAVAGDTIVAVGRREDVLRAHPRAREREWAGVITAGLVNAHTHLQYSSFGAVGAAAHPTYVRWAERFVAEYDARAGEDWRATALAGIAAGLRTGTTCFADVVTDAEAMDVLVAADVAGVAYYEIIGVDAEQWEDHVGADVAAVLTSAAQSPAARVGLSPHAPYSVAEPVLIAATGLARRLGLRLHTHLAEIDTEEQLYRSGTGAWAERVRSRVRRPWPLLDAGGVGLGTAEYAERCRLLGPDTHVAHGVYLDEAGRRLLARRGTCVALCPRSNAIVGIGPPPVAAYLRERVPFAVGTDSLGSTRSLDLLEDVAELRRLAVDGGYLGEDVDRRLLDAATLGGARALGLSELVGALTPGRRADFAVFDVDPGAPAVERALVESGAGRCLGVVTGGRER